MSYYDYAVAFVVAGLVVSYFLFWKKKPDIAYGPQPVDHMENALRAATEAVKTAAQVHNDSVEEKLPDHIHAATVDLAMGAQKALEVVHASAEAAKRDMEDKHGD